MSRQPARESSTCISVIPFCILLQKGHKEFQMVAIEHATNFVHFEMLQLRECMMDLLDTSQDLKILKYLQVYSYNNIP